MDDMVSCLNTKFDELSKQVIDLDRKCDELASNQQTINESIQQLILMVKKEQQPASEPSFLPFRTVEEIKAFNDCNMDEFNDLVKYFIYVGEPNISRCVSIFLNNGIAVQGEILHYITWQGARSNIGLKTTKFFKACEKAINTLVKPTPLGHELNKPFEMGLKALMEQLKKKRNDETGVKKKEINMKKSIISGKEDDADKENEYQINTYLIATEEGEGDGELTDPIMNVYASEEQEEEAGAEQYPLIPENGLNATEENEFDLEGSTLDSSDLFD